MERNGRPTLAWAVILTVSVGLGIARAQDAAQLTGDHDFVSRVAMSNMVAIQLGHMATKKAHHTAVKQFAQTTIDDHLRAQQLLADAAYGAGVQWPKKLDERYQQIAQRLSSLSNEKFDQEFMKAMVDSDRDAETMIAARAGGIEAASAGVRPARNAQSDESPLAAKVNQWAAKTLPAVRAHLKEAEQVIDQLNRAE